MSSTNAIDRSGIAGTACRRLRHWLLMSPLTWNPVFKIGRRMWPSPEHRNARIIPLLNGRDANESGLDANFMCSLFGWGWLSGWAVEKFTRNDGTAGFRSVIDKSRKHWMVPCRRFGRITITWRELPPNY